MVNLQLPTCMLSQPLLCVAAGWAVYDKLKLRRRKGEKWTESSELTLGKVAPSILSGNGLLQIDLTCRVQLQSWLQQLQLSINFGSSSCQQWQVIQFQMVPGMQSSTLRACSSRCGQWLPMPVPKSTHSKPDRPHWFRGAAEEEGC